MDDNEKLTSILRHIKRVEDNCNHLAKALQKENFHLALKLIKLGRIHDASKLDVFEFRYLHKGEKNFEEALKNHHERNPHHPEYWNGGGIHAMPDEYIAEMVCDCVARGQEFGTDTRVWFRDSATKKYFFTMEDECGKLIQKYLDLLLSKPF